jgi:hypothetical protein
MEFTDLFIAIARAAGIPARQAVGYAYTTNSRLRPLSLISDVLHAWPEYYDFDKKVWIAVDPTWANTTGGVNYFDKLDFNHIVFALQGVSSNYPYPAGFYRRNGKTTKDVAVDFANSAFTKPTAKLSAEFSFPNMVTAGISSRGSLTISNTQGVAVPEVSADIQSAPVDVALNIKETNFPPFARITIPLTMTVPNYLTGGTGRFVVTVNGTIYQHSFTIQPITAYFIIPIVAFSAFILLLLAMIISRLYLWKRHKKR